MGYIDALPSLRGRGHIGYPPVDRELYPVPCHAHCAAEYARLATRNGRIVAAMQAGLIT